MNKKICHLLISYGNKNQIYTSELLDNLSNNSNDEHFIYCHHRYKNSEGIKVVNSRDKSKISILGSVITTLLKNKDFRQLYQQVGRNEILKWIALIDYGFDVLHVHHEHAISLKMLEYFKRKGIKIIISLRGRDLLVNTNNKEKFKELNQKLKHADVLHSISGYMNSKLNDLLGLEGVVINRGQELPKTENQKTTITSSNTIRIILVGRLVWEKGHIFFLETVSRLKKSGYIISADIYGDGNLKEFLSFRIKQLDLENEVVLKGYVDNKELKSIYKTYDLAVQPSLSEALSNGLIDFSLHNLPCVISDYGGMSEVIKHNVNGIVFNGTNMLLMDNAILETKNLDFERLNNCNNQNRIKFSKQKEIEEIQKLYTE